MEIQLPACTLRPWRTGDIASLVRYANNYAVARNLRDSFPHPYTRQDAIAWIQQVSVSEPITNFAIDVRGESVGGVGLMLRSDVYRRSAEIGYWLGEPFWNRGIMTDVVRAVTEYAFATFSICRLYAGVFDYNTPSMHVLRNAGFVHEATLRRSITKNNITYDEVVFALVR